MRRGGEGKHKIETQEGGKPAHRVGAGGQGDSCAEILTRGKWPQVGPAKALLGGGGTFMKPVLEHW